MKMCMILYSSEAADLSSLLVDYTCVDSFASSYPNGTSKTLDNVTKQVEVSQSIQQLLGLTQFQKEYTQGSV